jgi:hypothetical protein
VAIILLGADTWLDVLLTHLVARAPYGQLSPPSGTVLLTVCSHTVRILLDVPAHVRGKHAGQVHKGGRVRTSWDRLVGFKSPAFCPSLAASANPGATRSVSCPSPVGYPLTA